MKKEEITLKNTKAEILEALNQALEREKNINKTKSDPQKEEVERKKKESISESKENIKQKIKELEESLDMIEYKCWYYDEAIKDNSEERVKNILPCNMPKEVKKNYQNSHNFNTNY